MPRHIPSMIEAIQQVWQIIGNDILLGEEDKENPVLNGLEVAEIVADYVETYIDPRLHDEYRNATWEQRHAWRDEAFPAKSLYGF